MNVPSTAKVKNFRKKLFDLTEEELRIRAQLKQLYAQFCLDVQDEELALRHVRQAYYNVQKFRVRKKLEELMEFHPFFGAHTLANPFEDSDGDQDDIL